MVPPAPAKFSITAWSRIGVGGSPDARHRLGHLGQDRVEAAAEVAAEMEHDAVGLDRLGGGHRVVQRPHRLLVHLVIRRAQIDQVGGVADDARRGPACAPPEAGGRVGVDGRLAATCAGSA